MKETKMSSADADPLASTHKLFLDAVRAGDVTKLVSMYCEDAVLMPPNEPSLYGRSEVQEWYEDYFQHFRIVTIDETEREVTVIANGWVIERYAYMVAIAPLKGGERIRDDGRWFHVWKRESDGEWRIAQAMFNSIRPIGSGTSRYITRMSERNKIKTGVKPKI
jgi:ketosteroid isomerase-like protein